MNRIFLSCCFFVLFTSLNQAQYTDIINANRPGNTETPYAVGLNVEQLETSVFYENFNNSVTFDNIQAAYTDVKAHFGFLLERLEVNFNQQLLGGTFNGDYAGLGNFGFGLKYLIYDHVNKEGPELKRSWKRRYGFKYNGLIPSVGVAVNFRTPWIQVFGYDSENESLFTPIVDNSIVKNSNYLKQGSSSFNFRLITQNNINKKLRINNQFEYNYYLGGFSEMVYSVSSSYVLAKRWNPYFQFQFHGLNTSDYYSLGLGTPFLVNRNFAISAHYNTSFGNNITRHQAGLNFAYRFDNHKDEWVKIKKSEKQIKDEKKLVKEIKKAQKEKEPYLDEFAEEKEDEFEAMEEELNKKDVDINDYIIEEEEQEPATTDDDETEEDDGPKEDIILSY